MYDYKLVFQKGSRNMRIKDSNHHLIILYNVCFGQEDSRFKQALKIRNPKNRLKRIYDACKSKKYCANDEHGVETRGHEEDSQEPLQRIRGGCGAKQPHITIDGMKMVAEYKPSNRRDDDKDLPEPAERKQVLSAERVSFLSIYDVYFHKSKS
ncbi:hypothetical protein Taro_051233 [Colocasia esculenta]|uniref:Uncharacterized protein n=1 Tax=Colocasia esculenta TaxID=4460 RepID=A0A843XG01_COLES|nr:hypothetical protein [Colocasia esculenta]